MILAERFVDIDLIVTNESLFLIIAEGFFTVDARKGSLYDWSSPRDVLELILRKIVFLLVLTKKFLTIDHHKGVPSW